MWCQYADLGLQQCLYPRLLQRPLHEPLYRWWLSGRRQMSDLEKVPCKWAREGDDNLFLAGNSNTSTYTSITFALLPSIALWQGRDPWHLGRELTFLGFILAALHSIIQRQGSPVGSQAWRDEGDNAAHWDNAGFANHRVPTFVYHRAPCSRGPPQWSWMRQLDKAKPAGWSWGAERNIGKVRV